MEMNKRVIIYISAIVACVVVVILVAYFALSGSSSGSKVPIGGR